MMTAQYGSTMSGPAVIETRPESAPLRMASRSTRPNTGRDMNSAATAPADAARFVFTSTLLMATASATPARASCDPPLKPSHPNHRMRTPKVTNGTFEGGVGLMLPSGRNLPTLGPATMMPAIAAQPPVECTMVEPAKS